MQFVEETTILTMISARGSILKKAQQSGMLKSSEKHPKLQTRNKREVFLVLKV